MKVLIFTPQFHQLGGAERSVIELAVELNNRGIHTDVLSMYESKDKIIEEAKENLEANGVPNVHFLGLKVNPSFFSIFKAVYKLRKLVKSEKYTVVEASMVSPSIISILSFLGKDVRTIIGLRHVYKEGRESSLQHRLFKTISSWNKYVKYYAISEYAKKEWVKYSKVKEDDCLVVYNSIPKKFFEAKEDRDAFRSELGIPKCAKVAIFVGRYAAYKGIDVVFDALKSEVYKHNLYLLFIGHPDLDVPGTDQILKRISRDIDSEGLREKIRFLGVRNDIDRVMASSDVLVHPTRTEAFGRSLAEALAAGLPIVATDVEAVPEVLCGTHSILIPVDSTLALKNAVISILNKSSTELSCIKSLGCTRAKRFGIEERANAMVDLFDRNVIN